MSKPTRKKEAVVVITKAEMEQALADYQQARIDEQRIIGELNAAVALAREPYDLALQLVTQRIDNSFARVKTWADANPAEFETTKSIAKPIGSIGYRIGNWTVKAAKGWTLKKVLEFMLARAWLKRKYVRTEPELNKQALLLARVRLQRRPKYLEKIGIAFQREETFFVDANLLTTEPVKKEAA